MLKIKRTKSRKPNIDFKEDLKLQQNAQHARDPQKESKDITEENILEIKEKLNLLGLCCWKCIHRKDTQNQASGVGKIHPFHSRMQPVFIDVSKE